MFLGGLIDSRESFVDPLTTLRKVCFLDWFFSWFESPLRFFNPRVTSNELVEAQRKDSFPAKTCIVLWGAFKRKPIVDDIRIIFNVLYNWHSKLKSLFKISFTLFYIFPCTSILKGYNQPFQTFFSKSSCCIVYLHTHTQLSSSRFVKICIDTNSPYFF